MVKEIANDEQQIIDANKAARRSNEAAMDDADADADEEAEEDDDDDDEEADDNEEAEEDDEQMETRKKRKLSSGIDFGSLLVEKFPKVKTSGVFIFVDENDEITTGTDEQHDRFFSIVFSES